MEHMCCMLKEAKTLKCDPTDGETESGLTGVQIVRWTNGPTDRQIDRQTDGRSTKPTLQSQGVCN